MVAGAETNLAPATSIPRDTMSTELADVYPPTVGVFARARVDSSDCAGLSVVPCAREEVGVGSHARRVRLQAPPVEVQLDLGGVPGLRCPSGRDVDEDCLGELGAIVRDVGQADVLHAPLLAALLDPALLDRVGALAGALGGCLGTRDQLAFLDSLERLGRRR